MGTTFSPLLNGWIGWCLAKLSPATSPNWLFGGISIGNEKQFRENGQEILQLLSDMSGRHRRESH